MMAGLWGAVQPRDCECKAGPGRSMRYAGMRGGSWAGGSTLKGCYEGSSSQLSWDLEVLDRGQRQEVA